MDKNKVTKKRAKNRGIKIKIMRKFWIIIACLNGIFLILSALNSHFNSLSFSMLMVAIIFINLERQK